MALRLSTGTTRLSGCSYKRLFNGFLIWRHLAILPFLSSTSSFPTRLSIHCQAYKSLSFQSYGAYDGVKFSTDSEGRLQILPDVFSKSNMKPYSIDFVKLMKERQSSSPQAVSSAIGPADFIVDLTAGLGRDSMVLAARAPDTRLILLERNKVLYSLLRDGLYRLEANFPHIASRIGLFNMDAIDHGALASILHEIVDSDCTRIPAISVYLDPMYPPHTVGSKALVKRETQILQEIVSDTKLNTVPANPETEQMHSLTDRFLDWQTKNAFSIVTGVNDREELQLMASAWLTATSRVVVKRPNKSAPLANIPAHTTLKGTRQRFDIYFKNRNLFA